MIFVELLVLLALTLVNAVFAGAEIAVVAARRGLLQQLAQAGRRDALAVMELRHQPERFFASVQIGITVIGATAGAFGGRAFAEDLEPLLAPLPAVGPHAEGVALAIVVMLVSSLSIVLGELVPKSLALKHAEAYALFIARPLLGISKLARPVVWLLTTVSNLLLRPFGDRTTFSEGRISAEEIREMVEEASKSGTVDVHVGEIASRALDLAGLTAKDVMVPRHRVDAIPLDATPDDLKRILLEQGHTRMPVFQQRLDDVVGYLVVKDVLGILWGGSVVILEDIIRPAFFVPETMLARNVLREFQRRRTQLAVVVDEHGALAGIVTLEDIIEELVGDLWSEDDVEEELIVREEGGALVRAEVPIREVNRSLGLELPEGPSWSTVGGLCMHVAGGVPAERARLTIPAIAELEIVKGSARAVRLVRIAPLDTPSGEER